MDPPTPVDAPILVACTQIEEAYRREHQPHRSNATADHAASFTDGVIESFHASIGGCCAAVIDAVQTYFSSLPARRRRPVRLSCSRIASDVGFGAIYSSRLALPSATCAGDKAASDRTESLLPAFDLGAVSYTHLTLPTNREV